MSDNSINNSIPYKSPYHCYYENNQHGKLNLFSLQNKNINFSLSQDNQKIQLPLSQKIYDPNADKSNPSNPFVKLILRFGNISKRNPDILPIKHQRKHTICNIIRGVSFITFSVYFLGRVSYNYLYNNQKGKFSLLFKFAFGFMFLQFFNNVLYIANMFPAFDEMFTGMTYESIEKELDKMKESILILN
jgi:hypothetical protein